MAKSKKHYLALRSGGRDFELQPSIHAPSRVHRAPLQALSPVQSNPESSSQALPPRPKLTFGDFASSPIGIRVSAKTRSKSSSSASCARKGVSSEGFKADQLARSEGHRALQRDGLPLSPSAQTPCGQLPPTRTG
jgi:hypothetical protein